MSESEKKVPILHWAMELESLKALLLVCAILCLSSGCRPSSAEPPESLSGRWTGSGTFRGQADPAILDFYQIPGGWRAFGGRADLPEDLFTPLRNVRYQHPHLSFDLHDGPEHLSFEGTVSGKTIKVVSRGQNQVVFELQRTGDAPPLPFTEEAIEVRNGEGNLGGDLLLPPGPGPHPAIVLIHGSGKGTRDSCRSTGNLFVRHGVAALLYDKRDVGGHPSGMDLVDHHDLTGDALAAVALLKARDDIRKDQIGLWGGSQGSTVAAIAAARSADVAFVIAVSPSGVSYAELYISAAAHVLRSRGFSEREVIEATVALRRLNDFVRKGNPQGAQPMLEEARRKRWFEFSSLPSAPPTETELRTWIRWRNLDLDPTSYWESVKIPVLLIFGERERLVPVDRSVKGIREAFRRAGNTKHTIKVFPGADHQITVALNQTASDQPSVAANKGRTIAPGYLDAMTGWLREQLRLAR
jgi:pimeloyl-ACP methyl ester carboxylesterase